MASRIETLLNTIATAIYGRDMRDAIHDSIEECYTDVSTAKTLAEDATAAANDAAYLANIASDTANAVIIDAEAATASANNAAEEATMAKNDTITATNNAIAATNNAIAAKNDTIAAKNDAAAAAALANTKASLANEKAALADTAASNANTKATLADTKATLADTAATSATTAANSANAATNAAITAKNDAIAATSDAITATNNAIAAKNDATAAAQAATVATLATNNAISQAEDATLAANTATNAANIATTDAITAKNDANTAAQSATTAAATATTAANNASSATTRANAAADLLDLLTVDSENVPYTTPADASISTISGHKNIHFLLRQGQPGPGFIIKGNAYETVADLEAAITNPEIGDQYNVGTSYPYVVYRWTGTTWENQGVIGSGVEQITVAELQTLDSGGTITGGGSKALGVDGTTYLIQTLLVNKLDTKVDKITGKGLSTNDFTTTYKDQVDANEAAIQTLSTNKVDKVTGKSLSTNDFTDAYKTKVDAHDTAISSLSSDKVDKVTGKDLSTNDFTDTYKNFIDNYTVDAALSISSPNPVRNSVVTAAINAKQSQHKKASATVATSAWDSSTNTATVNMTGVTSDNDVFVTYDASSFDIWMNSGIRGTGQGNGTITLTARSIPNSSVTVIALIFD